MGFIGDILKRNKEIEWMFDLDMIQDTSQRAYLKRMALDTCIQFLGRAIAQSDFQVRDGTKNIKNTLYYKLNVRPNTDMSSTTFWEKVIYKLVYDGECLIILSDTDDFLIADSFTRDEYAVYDDVFKEVIVKDYEFKRPFPMSKVMYLEYGNTKLSRFLDGLFDDYGEILGRMINAQLRNYQLRGIVNIDQTGTYDDAKQAKLQGYIQKIFRAFSKNSVAIIPQLNGFTYEELGATRATTTQSIDELTKLKKSVTDDVAKILGIPPALIHGEMADLKNNMKSFEKFCKNFFVKKIQDEMNAKFFSEKEYLNGKRIRIITPVDIFENAEAIDKIISSGSLTRNDVLDEMGYERSDNPELDKHVITKNYETIDKVGENE
ncbi:phage portal protein [Listeria booriae]|uniref:phage portal protein n=1 Tax=Listeria booriae TaxID=1552123 RepID=UPI001629FBD2|nr:phage portal protein [Listeria booriae]MBC1233635.1 phage portal protein [Listeria booriae]